MMRKDMTSLMFLYLFKHDWQRTRPTVTFALALTHFPPRPLQQRLAVQLNHPSVAPRCKPTNLAEKNLATKWYVIRYATKTFGEFGWRHSTRS